MTAINYIFYYKLTSTDERHIVTTKLCKMPKRTKVWKQLVQGLEAREFHTIGFDIESSNEYIIQDWAGNRMFPTKTFDSFEDGWEYIYENIEDEEGAYEDVYVLRVSSL